MQRQVLGCTALGHYSMQDKSVHLPPTWAYADLKGTEDLCCRLQKARASLQAVVCR